MVESLSTRVNNENVCQNCQVWHFALGDRFCGWCGQKFESFKITLSNKNFVINRDELNVRLTITLKNLSHTRADITGMDFSDERLVTLMDFSRSDFPISIEPGAEMSWEIEIDTVPIDGARNIDIAIYSNLQDEPIRESIWFMPAPIIEFSAEKEYNVNAFGDAEENFPIDIIIQEGIAEIDEIATEYEWMQIIPAIQIDPEQPFILDAAKGPNQLHCLVKIKNEAVDKENLEKLSEKKTSVKIQAFYKKQLVTETILQINFVIPPLFFIEGANEEELINSGDKKQFDQILKWEKDVFIGGRLRKLNIPFPIGNRGGLALSIESLEVVKGGNLLEFQGISFKKMMKNNEALESSILSISLCSLVAGINEVDIIFISNHKNKKNAKTKLKINLFAEEMPEYEDDIIAFDFGTTNSCCVVLDLHRSSNDSSNSNPYKILHLDWKSDIYSEQTVYPQHSGFYSTLNDKIPGIDLNTSVPSIITYLKKLRFENKKLDIKEYSIGTDAKERLVEPKYSKSIVLSIKNKLGLHKRYPVYFAHNDNAPSSEFLPEEISADIIFQMLARAEYFRKAKIKKCYISHPVGFVRERKDAIKKAFENAGIEISTEDQLWPEPLCAAYYFIATKLVRNDEIFNNLKEIYLLVYDLGGGTTDLSYLKIDFKRDLNIATILKPTIIDQDGHRRYGGDNITDAIVHEFAKQIFENHKDIPILKPFSKTIGKITNELEIGLVNYYTLWLKAEEIKKDLSKEEKQTEQSAVVTLKNKNNNPILQDVILNQKLLKEIAEEEIKTTFVMIDNILKRATGKINKEFPDYILMSGNACRMPLVRELMHKKYPEAKIVFPESYINTDAEPENFSNGNFFFKECVALGLSIIAMAKELPGEISIESLTSYQFSSVDLGILAQKGAKQVYIPVINKGDEFNHWRPPAKPLHIAPGHKIFIYERIAPNLYEEVAKYELGHEALRELTDEQRRHMEVNVLLTKEQELEIRIVAGAGTNKKIINLKKEKLELKPW